MYANPRISLGVAFLNKKLSATSYAKCIIHAEYVLKTKQYLLTRVTFTHTRSVPLNVKTSETVCDDVSDLLKKMSARVERKIEEGFGFDAEGMEIMNEADETWGDFEMVTEMTPSIVGASNYEMSTGREPKRKTLSIDIQARSLSKSKTRSLKHLPQKLQRH